MKLRGQAKKDFLERMARGKRAASRRRKNSSKKRAGSSRKSATSRAAATGSRRRIGSTAPRTGATTRRKKLRGSKRRRRSNPQLLTVNSSRSRSAPRSRSSTAANRARRSKPSPRRSRRVGAKRANPQLLTINPSSAKMQKALKAYRTFHGVDPKKAFRTGNSRNPTPLIALGELKELIYQPRRGQRKGPAFFHNFKPGSLVAATADGKRLVIIDRKKGRKAVDFNLGIVN